MTKQSLELIAEMLEEDIVHGNMDNEKELINALMEVNVELGMIKAGISHYVRN
jgi:hypothetical protein